MKTEQQPIRPWYREPWPWVIIAIPLLTVIASGITFWLAISNPDPIVVHDAEYDKIRSELRAQGTDEVPVSDPATAEDDG